MIRSPWPCLLVAALACSSGPAGSGVTPTKLLSALSASERDKLCSYRTEVEHAPRTVSCPDTTSVMLKDKASCVSAFGSVTIQCQAQVSDAEGCFQALNDDPCSHGDGACTTLFTCVLPTD